MKSYDWDWVTTVNGRIDIENTQLETISITLKKLYFEVQYHPAIFPVTKFLGCTIARYKIDANLEIYSSFKVSNCLIVSSKPFRSVSRSASFFFSTSCNS